MTDSRLLAEARIIARLKVSRMSEDLGLGNIKIYKTHEEISVGMEILRRNLEFQKLKLARLRMAAEEANRTMQLFNARLSYAAKFPKED